MYKRNVFCSAMFAWMELQCFSKWKNWDISNWVVHCLSGKGMILLLPIFHYTKHAHGTWCWSFWSEEGEVFQAMVCVCYRYELAIRSHISVYSGALQQAEWVSAQPSVLRSQFAVEDHGDASALPRQTSPEECGVLPSVQCWVWFHVRAFYLLYRSSLDTG